ncbi:MAG: lamin tail domain-containing protein [Myxococcales bacterium]|nr:lamin tail domain-containing protein [Myxococcales bacterium]
MRPVSLLPFVVLAGAALAACASSKTDDNPTTTTHTTSSTTTSGSGGTGGSGATGGSGGDSGNGICDLIGSDHLLVSEVGSQPDAAEFIEIWNPGSTTVDLAKYYLSDNAAYYGIAAGTAWNPQVNQPGSDFLAAFPPGTTLGPNEVLTIQAGTDFFGTFAVCPDFVLAPAAAADTTCNGSVVPKLVEPANGGIGNSVGSKLSNAREMLMLFCWDAGPRVTDVDYVTWGPDDPAEPTRVDKTSVAGYLPDTARAQQSGAPAPALNEAIGRCTSVETGETTTGGNGAAGHDETSESMATTFSLFPAGSLTPGTVNPCN